MSSVEVPRWAASVARRSATSCGISTRITLIPQAYRPARFESATGPHRWPPGTSCVAARRRQGRSAALLALHLDCSESGDRCSHVGGHGETVPSRVASQGDVVRVGFSAGWQAAWTADSLANETLRVDHGGLQLLVTQASRLRSARRPRHRASRWPSCGGTDGSCPAWLVRRPACRRSLVGRARRGRTGRRDGQEQGARRREWGEVGSDLVAVAADPVQRPLADGHVAVPAPFALADEERAPAWSTSATRSAINSMRRMAWSRRPPSWPGPGYRVRSWCRDRPARTPLLRR